MSTREVIFPPGRQALYEKHRYSAAVRSGELLFVSGQVGSDDDGEPVQGFEAQLRQAFARLDAVLKAAGCGFEDILDITTFHTDPQAQFGTLMALRDEWIKAPYPAWTAVGVNWLAGFDFEIKVIARIPG